MSINNVAQQNVIGNLPFTAKAHLIVHSLHAGEQILMRKRSQQQSGVQIRQAEQTRKHRNRGIKRRRTPAHYDPTTDDRPLDVLA